MIWVDVDFWPRSNTAYLGPVTGPIRNNLINNIILSNDMPNILSNDMPNIYRVLGDFLIL